MTPTIEPATPEDAKAIVDIQRQTWLDTYPNEAADITEHDIQLKLAGEHGELIPSRIERWRQRISSPESHQGVFIARMGEEAVGFTAPAIMEGQRRIGAIYVLPKAQGKGIGIQLLRKAVDWHRQQAPAEPIFLHVVSYNQKAIRFYERFGFKKTGKTVSDEIAKLPSGKTIPEIEMKLDSRSS